MVAFVTNGYWIDGLSHDGMRKSLVDEFTSIYCLNLRGNQRGTQGDISRREGGKIFGGGSRAPVALTLLVKNRDQTGPAHLRYHDIGDYLTREHKLARVKEYASVADVPWISIVPNAHGDWINQRAGDFEELTPLVAAGADGSAPIFQVHSAGINSSRDAWVYNFARDTVATHTERMITAFNAQVTAFKAHCEARALDKPADLVDEFIDRDPKKISWSEGLRKRVARARAAISFDSEQIVIAQYRPFCKQHLYYSRDINERVYQEPRVFPPSGDPNMAITVTGVGARRNFSALMVNAVPNYHLQDSGQVFPHYYYEEDTGEETLLSAGGTGGQVAIDNIGPLILEAFRSHYADSGIGADDVFFYVYGLLHSPRYRAAYAAELRKMLPRVPMLNDFSAYSKAGRELADLHLHYETAEPYGLDEVATSSVTEPAARYRVERMRFAAGKDRTTIIYNAHVTLRGIPARAYEYEVNGKPAIEWIIDRYQVRIDGDSGIVNDPNAYATDPRYVIDLLRRVITVSLGTVAIVDRLRDLESSASADKATREVADRPAAAPTP
jgi:predicted helicase